MRNLIRRILRWYANLFRGHETRQIEAYQERDREA